MPKIKLSKSGTISVGNKVVGTVHGVTYTSQMEHVWRYGQGDHFDDEDAGRYPDTVNIVIKTGYEKYIQEALMKARIGFIPNKASYGIIEIRRDHVAMIDLYYKQMINGMPYAGLELGEFLERMKRNGKGNG